MLRRVLLGAAVALLVVGCANQEFKGPPPGGEKDNDNDGYTADVDCDDDDPNIHPEAAEQENCRDDNCDGMIDEGTGNADKDNDGYCPSTGDIGDCEGDPNRNPAMPEQANGIDDDCNGKVDDNLPTSDMDGDGFAASDGDCNDQDPNTNPGAIEVEGMRCDRAEECPIGKCFGGYCRCTGDAECSSNKACTKDADCTFPGELCKASKCVSTFVCKDALQGMTDPTLKVCRDDTDNDCDKQIDEMPTTCDELAKLNQDNPHDYARAIEICDLDQTCGVESKCPGKLVCVGGRCSRVLSASFNAKANKKARAIAVDFAKGGPYKPRAGQSFAILSTGVASYVASSSTDCPQDGTDFVYTETDPDPAAADKVAHDRLDLKLEIAVPTNAQSFAFDFHFFSTEYPEYVGTIFNDTFWVHLQSQKFTGNISFDAKGTPIRINNAFFSICDAYPAKPVTAQMCTKPASLNQGTGYVNECQKGSMGTFTVPNGGSTDWLHTTSPVTPGETITLTFTIFDKGDGILDSAVLIDNFRWKLAPATKPITGPD